MLRMQEHQFIVKTDKLKTKSRSVMKTPLSKFSPARFSSRQAGKLNAHLFAYLAFGAAVFASIAAAAAIASHGLPLMLGEF